MAKSTQASPRRYQTGELLGLRDSLSVVICPTGNVNKHADIASIFRLPPDAFHNPTRFSCNSKALLAHVQNHRYVSNGSRRHFTESSEDSEDHLSTSTNAKHDSRQYQWNLRRREGSDRSSQPRSAPTGTTAQQSENFQRFYRAVVSPTHVRVTAGGKIVPNTRATATAPPQFEWNSDVFHFEPKKYPDDDRTTGKPTWAQNRMVPIACPSASPNTSASPCNFVPYSTRVPAMTAANQSSSDSVNGFLSSKIPDLVQSMNYRAEIGQGAQRTGSLPQVIKISPPSQFDQNKPFVYNGQVVYPVPQPFQSQPTSVTLGMAMLGNPGFLPSAQLLNGAGYLQAPYPGPVAGFSTPMVFAGQQIPTVAPNFIPSDNMLPAYPYLGTRATGISPEVVKTQIQQLQSQIKFCDHQLLNNKHQIDEHAMELNRLSLINQVKSLELIMSLHTGQETGSPSRNQSLETSHAVQGTTGGPLVVHSTKIVTAHNSSHSSENRSDEVGTAARLLEASKGYNDSKSSSQGGSITKSKLSIKAPAFQPRSQALALTLQKHETGVDGEIYARKSEEAIDMETLAQAGTRLMAKSTSDLRASNISDSSPTISKIHSDEKFAVYGQNSNQGASFLHLDKHRRYGFPTTTAGPVAVIAQVPYLVGTLPHGINAKIAKSTDFLYPRQLTDAEVRARHLYWGKAQRAIQSGLPKFDGKDFYPPSPEKRTRRHSNHHSTGSTTDVSGASYSASTFRSLFVEPGVLGYRTRLPTEALQGNSNVMSFSQPVLPVGSTVFGMQSACSYSFTDSGISVTDSPTEVADKNTHVPQAPKPDPSTNLMESKPEDGLTSLLNGMLVVDYISPLPPKMSQTYSMAKRTDAEVPATPINVEVSNSICGIEDEVSRMSSWKGGEANSSRFNSETDTVLTHSSQVIGGRSSTSSEELLVSNSLSPRSAHEKAFVQRVENFRSPEQQTLFLQNMLKSTAQSPMVGAALSGYITSATAQGYLPQYRGSAAASLAPAMLNHAIDRESSHSQVYGGLKPCSSSLVALTTAEILSETRPPHSDRGQAQYSSGSNEFGAQGYMRYVAQKDDKNKKIMDQNFRADPPSAVPGSLSEW